MQTPTNSILAKLDWFTVLLWLALCCIGIVSVFAAVYDEDNVKGILDFASRSGIQAIWLLVAIGVASVIMLIEGRFFYTFAPILYGITLLLMLATLFFGKEVNSSKSWLMIGPVGIQTVEFMKITTVLLLARLLSMHNFRIYHLSDFAKAALVIAVPVLLTLAQHDLGSALVFFSLIIVFYRAGLPTWVVLSVLFIIFLFIISLLVEQHTIVIVLSLLYTGVFMMMSRRYKLGMYVLLGVALFTTGLYALLNWVLQVPFSLYLCLVIAHVLLLPLVLFYALWTKLRYLFVIVSLFVVSLGASYSVDYVVDHILEDHQRNRVYNLLGIEEDIQGSGYNVHQSKVAIGSGGFGGKGFLEGTQTKFNFVPEQSTDFIFCTIGEEWGFVGVTVVIGLYFLLLVRILMVAERQKSIFAKMYGYGVASIFFFHIMVNIGMTIGLMFVVGIPLPLISYGGSSLWAFTILLFILIKLDVAQYER